MLIELTNTAGEIILASNHITSNTIVSQPIFTPIRAIFRVLAILVVLWGTWKVIKALIQSSGEKTGAIRTALVSLGAAFLLWDITFAVSLVDNFQPIMTNLITSVTNVIQQVNR
jgi:hypothetical protein